MNELELIKKFEEISTRYPNRLLKIEGFVRTQTINEFLELIIFKGFSSSTTHPIEIDSEKEVLELNICFSKFKLLKAPLTAKKEAPLREESNYDAFLEEACWE